jgi:hypothetical protein
MKCNWLNIKLLAMFMGFAIPTPTVVGRTLTGYLDYDACLSHFHCGNN